MLDDVLHNQCVQDMEDDQVMVVVAEEVVLNLELLGSRRLLGLGGRGSAILGDFHGNHIFGEFHEKYLKC